MKTKIYSAATMVTFLSVILFSCKSVNKLYQKGDYDDAVLTAVKKLQKNKPKDDTKELIADAYAKAVNQRTENIRSLTLRNDELKWEAIAAEYSRMQQLTDAVNRSAKALQYVKPIDFKQQYADAAEQAATVRYNRGMQWMQRSDKQSARNAYYEFDAATRYRNGNRELEELRNRSFDAAATYIVVNPVSIRFYNYNEASQSIDRDLIHYLQCNAPSIFVKYYSPWEAQQLSRTADQVIDLVLDNVRRGNAQTDRTEREVYKDNVLLRERYVRPDSVVKEYGRVTAKIYTTKETINTTRALYITVRDAQSRFSLLDRRVEGNYCYTNESARFSGDERALSTEDKNRINNTSNNIPSERTILEAINRNLYDNITSELKYFYSRQ
jgi:hypothetical protein